MHSWSDVEDNAMRNGTSASAIWIRVRRIMEMCHRHVTDTHHGDVSQTRHEDASPTRPNAIT